MAQVLLQEEAHPTTTLQVLVLAQVTARHREVLLQEAAAIAADLQEEVRVVVIPEEVRAEAQAVAVVQATEDNLDSIQSNSNKQLILKS
jgi:hypothetical protein